MLLIDPSRRAVNNRQECTMGVERRTKRNGLWSGLTYSTVSSLRIFRFTAQWQSTCAGQSTAGDPNTLLNSLRQNG